MPGVVSTSRSQQTNSNNLKYIKYIFVSLWDKLRLQILGSLEYSVLDELLYCMYEVVTFAPCASSTNGKDPGNVGKDSEEFLTKYYRRI